MIKVPEIYEQIVNGLLEKYREALMEKDNSEVFIDQNDFNKLQLILGLESEKKNCIYFDSPYGNKIIKSRE